MYLALNSQRHGLCAREAKQIPDELFHNEHIQAGKSFYGARIQLPDWRSVQIEESME
jgi:hypothetical protein